MRESGRCIHDRGEYCQARLRRLVDPTTRIRQEPVRVKSTQSDNADEEAVRRHLRRQLRKATQSPIAADEANPLEKHSGRRRQPKSQVWHMDPRTRIPISQCEIPNWPWQAEAKERAERRLKSAARKRTTLGNN